MANRVLESFILGRNLALQQRELQRAEEQRQIENERAKKQDELQEKQEERLVKQAELDIRAKEAALKLQTAQLRAGIKSKAGQGEIPIEQEFGPRQVPAQILDIPGLPSQQLSPSTTINTEPGEARLQVGPEIEELLGGPQVLQPEELRQLQQAEARRIQRLATEAGLSPSVISQSMRIQADNIQEKSKQIFEMEKLITQDELLSARNASAAELRHTNALKEIRERANLNLIRDREKIKTSGIENSEELVDLTVRAATGQASLSNFPIKQRAAIEKTASDLGYIIPNVKEIEAVTTDLAQFPVMMSELNTALEGFEEIGFDNRAAAASIGRLQGLLPSATKDTLESARGKLAGLMRKLGEKGVISDKDINRGDQLFPDFSKNIATNRFRVQAIRDIYSGAINMNLARIPVKQRQLIFDNLGIPFKAENITAESFKSKLSELEKQDSTGATTTPTNNSSTNRDIHELTLKDGSKVKAYLDSNGKWVKAE